MTEALTTQNPTAPTTFKLATTKISTLDKARWCSRIIMIIGASELTAAQIYSNLEKECTRENIPMLSRNSFGRYIKELQKKGVIIGEGKVMASGRRTKDYYRRAI